MKASALTTQKRTDESLWRNYQIITYGRYNDQPQRWMEIAAASGTCMSCIDIYQSFINGQGFTDKAFYKAIVNNQGMTADKLLRLVSWDIAKLYGFALHFNYNRLYQKVEVNFVPFENVRFRYDEKTSEIIGFALHPDWGRRNLSIKPWDERDIKYVDFYDPTPEGIEKQVRAERKKKVKGTWQNWNGQILYCSMIGELQYPSPIYDAVLSDVSTEDAIASIKNRNSKNNWLPAGAFIRKVKKAVDTENNEESEKFKTEFKTFQGAENACKIIDVEIDFEEERPEFVPFEAKNYDKEFDYSEKSVQTNIGKRFMQPPILRSEDVSMGLSTDVMTNAYDFYNSKTKKERIFVEECFMKAFDNFHIPVNPTNDFTIIPLKYESNADNNPGGPPNGPAGGQ